MDVCTGVIHLHIQILYTKKLQETCKYQFPGSYLYKPLHDDAYKCLVIPRVWEKKQPTCEEAYTQKHLPLKDNAGKSNGIGYIKRVLQQDSWGYFHLNKPVINSVDKKLLTRQPRSEKPDWNARWSSRCIWRGTWKFGEVYPGYLQSNIVNE